MMLFPAILFFALLILFVLPLFHGIFNLGGLFGASVSGLLAAAFFFWKDTLHLLCKIWHMPGGRIVLSGAAAVAAAFVVYAVAVSALMVRAAGNTPAEENTTLVVLGCKVKNGRPSRMLTRRLEVSRRYLTSHPDIKVVVSGGKGDDETISEAQCMKDFLTEHGISRERIYPEERSVNTAQNLSFTMDIIASEDLCSDITVVTDGYHQLRASLIARRLGIRCRCLSAHTSWWLLPTYWVREWIAIACFYVMEGR